MLIKTWGFVQNMLADTLLVAELVEHDYSSGRGLSDQKETDKWIHTSAVLLSQ